MPRFRLRTTLVLAALVGAPLATASAPALATHSATSTGHDPHKYTTPHAGLVAPPRASGRLAPATGALLGTHSDDQHSGALTEADQGILRTEATSGRIMDIDNSYYGTFDAIANNWDPTRPGKTGVSKLAYWDLEVGRIPLIGWACGKSSTIKGGSASTDAIIRKTAQALKALKDDVMMRYCWEMDGSKRIGEVGSPEDFVAAWIHIWNIFKEEGVTNVVWVWTGNANGFKNKNDRGAYAWEYYPGDAYVDWVAADGYNWGASKRNSGLSRDRWRGFVEIYDEFMVWARSTGPVPKSMRCGDAFDYATKTCLSGAPEVFPRKTTVKPIQIGEYGAIEPEGSIKTQLAAVAPYVNKADWLRESHDTVNGSKPRTAECPWCGIYADIAAMVYFDIVGPNGPWIINSSEESKAAWRESAAQQDWFKQIHTIGWAPAAVRTDIPKPVQLPPVVEPPVVQPPVVQPPVEQASGGPARSGYWALGSDGRVYPFGEAKALGEPTASVGASAAGGVTAADVEATPSGGGYWVIDSAGRVFGYGDAGYFGGVERSRLEAGEAATSISATPTGKGYWIFTTRGRAVGFGDALFHGDMSKAVLNGPVLDSIPTPSGKGYYMVASDGGIFAFGDAKFFGSMGDKRLNAPVQSLVPDPDGKGYWLVASDGGVFAFEAPFRGSMGAARLNKPVTGMVPFGNGYLMVAEDGGIFNFATDKPFSGSLGDKPPARPIVSVTVLD